MKTFSLLLLILMFAAPSFATTWYVRTDGGTSVQCTGTTNAAYTGGTSTQWVPSFTYTLGMQVADYNGNLEQVTTAGVSAVKYPPTFNGSTGGTTGDNAVVWTNEGPMPIHQSCAVNSPFWLATINSPSQQFQPLVWVIAGGDTVQFADAGSYYNGLYNGVTGKGTYWQNCVANNEGCTLPPPPSGTSSAPTKIYGLGVGACHDSGHLNQVNSTTLITVNDQDHAFRLDGSSYVDMECITITQGDACTRMGTGAGHCTDGVNDYARNGILFENGAGGTGPDNLTLRDVAVMGTSQDGTLGAKFTGTTTISDLYLIGNGASGFNSDAGGCMTNCEITGTFNLSWPLIEWNGCLRVSAGVYNYCFDDVNAGYGDGMVFIAANGTMNVSHGRFYYNTQDGFDALHFNDDLTASPVLTITDSRSIGNQGSTYKVGGSTITAINNYSSGNCAVLVTASIFPSNPSGWNAGLTNPCRAQGDEWSIALNNGNMVKLQNNTSTGYGATMYDFSCAQGGTCTTGMIVLFQNNSNLGFPYPGGGGYPGGIYFSTSGMGNPFANAGSVISNNLWFNLRGICPQDSHETAYLCADPLMVTETGPDNVNPNLTSSSPGIGMGIAISGITTDFNGNTLSTPPPVGAFELISGSAPTPGGVFSGAVVISGQVKIP